jgi:hypothetical protein
LFYVVAIIAAATASTYWRHSIKYTSIFSLEIVQTSKPWAIFVYHNIWKLEFKGFFAFSISFTKLGFWSAVLQI